MSDTKETLKSLFKAGMSFDDIYDALEAADAEMEAECSHEAHVEETREDAVEALMNYFDALGVIDLEEMRGDEYEESFNNLTEAFKNIEPQIEEIFDEIFDNLNKVKNIEVKYSTKDAKDISTREVMDDLLSLMKLGDFKHFSPF